MARKSPNLTVSLPRCRSCTRHWRPPEGVSATSAYCKRCATERQAAAMGALALRPLAPVDVIGPYLVPRYMRPR